MCLPSSLSCNYLFTKLRTQPQLSPCFYPSLSYRPTQPFGQKEMQRYQRVYPNIYCVIFFLSLREEQNQVLGNLVSPGRWLRRRWPGEWSSSSVMRMMLMTMTMLIIMTIFTPLVLSGGGYAASAGADASGLMTLIGKQVPVSISHIMTNKELCVNV